MSEFSFKIYLASFKEGARERIEGSASPTFLDIQEKNLKFLEQVSIQIDVELTKEHLILYPSLKTEAWIPCAICNQDIPVVVTVSQFCHMENRKEIFGGFLDIRELLREALLLEVPQIAECKEGCPERVALAKYLTKKKEGNLPFQDL